MVGEVGESHRAVQVMADYTAAAPAAHGLCFEMLGPEFTAAHFRSRIEGFFAGAPDGWPCWAFSNHDVIRHVTRWAEHGAPDDVARLAAALLLSFEGSICLYQGEELGQTETELSVRRADRSARHHVLAGATRGATAAARRWSGTTA